MVRGGGEREEEGDRGEVSIRLAVQHLTLGKVLFAVAFQDEQRLLPRFIGVTRVTGVKNSSMILHNSSMVLALSLLY